MRNKNAKVSDPSNFISCAGDPERIIYTSKVLPSGEISLTPSGKENIQEEINSYRDGCDMAYILHELALGNTTVLNMNEGFYADLSKAPDNIHEVMEIMINGENAFHQLPTDVQQSFDNNYMTWIATSGSEDWIFKMQKVVSTTEDVNIETKEGESV